MPKMTNQNQKIVYMNDRLAHLGGDRSRLGKREIDTLLNVLRISKIPSNFGKVLDYGCGDQFIREQLEYLGADYIGVDADECDFENQQLPYEDSTFDCVVSLAVIEHLSNPDFYLKESMRVLRAGGVIYLTTPNWQMDYKNFYNDYTHKSPFTPKSIEMILRASGFRQIQTYPGLRCKPDWYYKGRFRFLKAYYLLPFLGSNRYAPSWLKGHSRSIIAVGVVP